MAHWRGGKSSDRVAPVSATDAAIAAALERRQALAASAEEFGVRRGSAVREWRPRARSKSRSKQKRGARVRYVVKHASVAHNEPISPKTWERVLHMVDQTENVAASCRATGVGRRTFYSFLEREEERGSKPTFKPRKRAGGAKSGTYVRHMSKEVRTRARVLAEKAYTAQEVLDILVREYPDEGLNRTSRRTVNSEFLAPRMLADDEIPFVWKNPVRGSLTENSKRPYACDHQWGWFEGMEAAGITDEQMAFEDEAPIFIGASGRETMRRRTRIGDVHHCAKPYRPPPVGFSENAKIDRCV